jgi:hypothetical protein
VRGGIRGRGGDEQIDSAPTSSELREGFQGPENCVFGVFTLTPV